MRFSETPVTDLDSREELGTRTEGGFETATDRGRVEPDTEGDQPEKVNASHGKREEAARIVRSIGSEFSKLRKQGRSGAWADLEDKLMKNADVLIDSGMVSAKEVFSIALDIEAFRKTEGGTAESPGDAIMKWLAEDKVVEEKPKRTKKVKA